MSKPLAGSKRPPPADAPRRSLSDDEGIVAAVRARLILKLNIPIAVVLFIGIFIWAGFQVESDEKFAMANLFTGVDRVVNTVTLGLRYSMMSNSRDDIQAIVSDYSRLREIREIRILNKNGQVMFSSNTRRHTRHGHPRLRHVPGVPCPERPDAAPVHRQPDIQQHLSP